MRILTFTDIHGNLNVLHKLKKQVANEKIALVLVPGDLTVMGQQLSAILSRLNMFKAPVYLIHGNHEDEEELETLLKSGKYKNLTFLHKQLIKKGKWWFGAYATSGMRDEYPKQEEWVKKHKKEIKEAAKEGKLIWLDHPPPAGTEVDELDLNWHAGSKSLLTFIKEFKPAYVFCGHLHETFGREDMVGDTIVINPGPKGKVIELK